MFVNNVKKFSYYWWFSYNAFSCRKTRRESEPKNEATTRNKAQTASKSKTNNDFIWTCQRVEKWRNHFCFWKTPDGRPTNDPSKKVTWIHNDPESEIVRYWVCINTPQNMIKAMS